MGPRSFNRGNSPPAQLFPCQRPSGNVATGPAPPHSPRPPAAPSRDGTRCFTAGYRGASGVRLCSLTWPLARYLTPQLQPSQDCPRRRPAAPGPTHPGPRGSSMLSQSVGFVQQEPHGFAWPSSASGQAGRELGIRAANQKRGEFRKGGLMKGRSHAERRRFRPPHNRNLNRPSRESPLHRPLKVPAGRADLVAVAP